MSVSRAVQTSFVWNVVVLLTSTATSTSLSANAEDDLHCGPRCLAVSLAALGVAYDYEDLVARFGVAGSRGFSLKRIEEVAASYGLETQLVKTSLENLQHRKRKNSFACICWTSGSHFVLCADYVDGKVLVIDPPSKSLQPAAAFAAKWQGEALLLSKQPLAREESLSWRTGRAFWMVLTGIVFMVGAVLLGIRVRMRLFALLGLVGILHSAQYGQTLLAQDLNEIASSAERTELKMSSNVTEAIALGNFLLGAKSKAKLSIVNDTERAWNLKAIGLSCSCLEVLAEKGDIRPSQVRELELVVSTSQGGTQNAYVTLEFANRIPLQIPLRWTVTHSLVTEPRDISFGEVPLVGTKELEFSVLRVDETGQSRAAKVTGVHAGSKVLHAEIKGDRIALRLTDCGLDESETGYVYVTDDQMKEDQRVSFSVSWQRPTPDFITLPNRLHLSNRPSKPMDAIISIYSPRLPLEKISTVEAVSFIGEEAPIKVLKWDEQHAASVPNRTRLSVQLEGLEQDLPKGTSPKIRIDVKFMDGRTAHVFADVHSIRDKK